MISLIATACSAAHGQLAWEQTQLELHPAAGDAEAVAHFKYENKGDKVIRFLSVRPSCGCTAAALKKNDVAPGEKGEITATFNIGARTGIQQKTLNVETDDPAHQFTVLTMRTVIAQLADVQPTFVFWEAGEEPKAKTIIVKAGKDVVMKNIAVTSSSPAFTTEVRAGAGPGEFRINVRPRDTSKPADATLTIVPAFENQPGKSFFANARITGPAAAAR
ncbi:MAG: DUF1573 domain-containing protein [Chthoniobacterales bacterium]